jgi:hypothetical protein
MATKLRKDLHLYLTPEDQKKFEAVKRIMVDLGMPSSSTTPQAVIRFALSRASQSARTEKAA